MRVEQEMTHLLSEVRHEVANEFTKLMFLILRLRLGKEVTQDKLKNHEEEIKRVTGPFLREEVEGKLYHLRRKVHEDRKVVIRRYFRRYAIHAGEGR